MKRNKIILLLVLFSCVPFMLRAQYTTSGPLELGIFGGVSTYNGDLQEMTFTYKQSHPAFGVFLSKEIYNGFGVEFGVNFGKLSGADSLSSDSSRRLRNLDFQSGLLDVHLLIKYNYKGFADYGITPYVFVGVGVFHFDPYTQDTTGGIRDKYYLQPLHTEGQGLKGYPDRKPYNLTQFSIPFGVGVKYAVSDIVNVGLVFSMRKTFTDYIDDVSKTYVDKNSLAAMDGPASIRLSYRTNELPGHENDPYPAEGSQRGSPKAKDFYFFTGLKLSFNIFSKSKAAQRALDQVACPPSY